MDIQTGYSSALKRINMKVALCLSGQARFLEACYYDSIKPNILDKFYPDVFIHTWDPTDNVGKPFINGGGHAMGEPVSGDLISRMLELYNPTSYIVEPQVPFEFGKWPDRLMPGIRSDYMYSMFYSIYKSNELKKHHEQKISDTYDWVIRSRFDVATPSGPLPLHSLDNNKLYVAGGCFDPGSGYLDSFAFSSSEIMDVYSDTYNQIDNIANSTDIRICGEYVLRNHIDSNNIEVTEQGTHTLYR